VTKWRPCAHSHLHLVVAIGHMSVLLVWSCVGVCGVFFCSVCLLVVSVSS
jgi:hypothetical protein